MSILIKEEIGLFYGLSSNVLWGLLECSYTGDIDKRNELLELLNVIGDGIEGLENYSFEKGVLGIAWSIEFLAQNKLLEINSNEILEVVDDEIYKYILNFLSTEKKEVFQLLGLINYCEIRLANKDFARDNYRSFAYLECLKLLTESLGSELLLLLNIDTLLSNNLSIVSIIIIKMSGLMHYLKKLDEPFYTAMEFLIRLYENKVANIPGLIPDIYTNNCQLLLLAAKNHKNTYWERSLYLIYQKLLSQSNHDAISGINRKKLILTEQIFEKKAINWAALQDFKRWNSSTEDLVSYLTIFGSVKLDYKIINT